MSAPTPARVAFLMLSDDPARAVPGLVMAARLKANRGADVRILFFGPGVRLATSGAVDEQLEALAATGARIAACAANVEQYGVGEQAAERSLTLLAAGAEVEEFAHLGYTVLSF